MANTERKTIASTWTLAASSVKSYSLSVVSGAPDNIIFCIKLSGDSAPQENEVNAAAISGKNWSFSHESNHDIYLKYIGDPSISCIVLGFK